MAPSQNNGKKIFRKKIDAHLWKKINQLSPEATFAFALSYSSPPLILNELKKKRGKGRNDYPIPLAWTQVLSKMILKKTSTLSKFSISRFLSFLTSNLNVMETILQKNLTALHQFNPLFGKILVAMQYKEKKGEIVHYLLDGITGLPLALTRQIQDPLGAAQKLLKEVEKRLSSKLYNERYLIASAEYDNPSFLMELWDCFQIKPIIPYQARAANPSPLLVLNDQVKYNREGELFCTNGFCLTYKGFEKKRNTLKYGCTAQKYNVFCPNKENCSLRRQGIRIPLHTHRSIFTPIPRLSYKWKLLYEHYKTVPLWEGYLNHFINENRTFRKKRKPLLYWFAILILSAQMLGLNNYGRPALLFP